MEDILFQTKSDNTSKRETQNAWLYDCAAY